MSENTESSTNVTRETLEDTAARSFVFLRGVASNIVIRTALKERGYTTAEHLRGWNLVHGASYYAEPTAELKTDGAGSQAVRALKLLDDWDEDGFRVVTATLRHRHVAQAEFVLEGLKPTTGPAAVLGVAKLLMRLDALENSPDREATRDADHAALATLESRGITKAERTRLRGLVEQAQVLGETDTESPAAAAAREEEHVAALHKLRIWYVEWADIARSTIKRRDHLITLGLAHRKPRKKDEEPK